MSLRATRVRVRLVLLRAQIRLCSLGRVRVRLRDERLDLDFLVDAAEVGRAVVVLAVVVVRGARTAWLEGERGRGR